MSPGVRCRAGVGSYSIVAPASYPTQYEQKVSFAQGSVPSGLGLSPGSLTAPDTEPPMEASFGVHRLTNRILSAPPNRLSAKIDYRSWPQSRLASACRLAPCSSGNGDNKSMGTHLRYIMVPFAQSWTICQVLLT